jgi:hypothetical protein
MQGYIIICYTNIHNSTDLTNLSDALASFSTVIDWTIDLTDSDKVLRMETSQDITTTLITDLEKVGVRCNVMETFINHLCDY